MQLFSDAHLCPTDLSLCVSRTGYVPHFKLSALSTSLHYITEHLHILAMGISSLFHKPLGLISNTLHNSSLALLWALLYSVPMLTSLILLLYKQGCNEKQ